MTPDVRKEGPAKVADDSDPDNPCFDVRIGEGDKEELIWAFDTERRANLLRDSINRALAPIVARAEMAQKLADDLQCAKEQWGDDYLWKKWNLSESLSAWDAMTKEKP